MSFSRDEFFRVFEEVGIPDGQKVPLFQGLMDMMNQGLTQILTESIAEEETAVKNEQVNSAYDYATEILGEFGYKQTEVRRDQNGVKIFVDEQKTKYFSYQIRETEIEYRAMLKRDLKKVYNGHLPPIYVSHAAVIYDLIKFARMNALRYFLFGGVNG